VVSRKTEIHPPAHRIGSEVRIPERVSESLERLGGLEQVTRSIPPRSVVKRVSGIFQSLSDPVRLSILYALSMTPLCVCVIKSILKIADSLLSYHLDDLKSAGLVSAETQGRFIVYRITDLGRELLSICGRLRTTGATRKTDRIQVGVQA
jgi:ArsR family transcriptional regulator